MAKVMEVSAHACAARQCALWARSGAQRDAREAAALAEGRFTRISAHTHAHAQYFANNCGSKHHQRLEREHLRFLLDGSRINEDDTALSLELEDHDMIDAFPASYGGPLYFYGSEAYCCPSSDEEGAAELCDTAGGGSLIPSSFVSFCEDPTHKGGFTPVYEPADGCSYSAFASMSSVHAGVFQLHVGGGAIDRSFLPSPVPFRGRRWLRFPPSSFLALLRFVQHS